MIPTPPVDPLSRVKAGQRLKWVVQSHKAKRAGPHYDLRFGSREMGGLYSWALPKSRLPDKPGEAVLAIQQPIHSYDYGDFTGTLRTGRGAGEVTMADTGQVSILEASPDRIRFSLVHSKTPVDYVLARRKDDKWILINVTQGRPRERHQAGAEDTGCTRAWALQALHCG